MPAQLPARDRELLDEDDLPRHLLVGEHLGDVLAELGLELLGAVEAAARHDEGAHEVAAALEVPDADDRGCRDRVVPGEHALDLERAERPAARRDDVLGATDEGEVPFLVDLRDVSGQVPVAEERRLRLLGELPVAGEEGRRTAPNGEVALDPGRKLVSLVVDDRDVVAGERTADRAGLRRAVREVGDHDVRLRLSVAVVDGHAPTLLEHGDDLGIEEVAGGDEAAEARRAEALELRVLGERRVLAGGLAEDARPEPEEQVEPLVDLEPAVVEDDLGAARPRTGDRVPHGQRRGGVARAPDGVAAADVEPVLGLDARREDGAVRVRRPCAFRRLRGWR